MLQLWGKEEGKRGQDFGFKGTCTILNFDRYRNPHRCVSWLQDSSVSFAGFSVQIKGFIQDFSAVGVLPVAGGAGGATPGFLVTLKPFGAAGSGSLMGYLRVSRRMSTGYGHPERAGRESREGFHQISLVSGTLGNKTCPGQAMKGKLEKGHG